MELHRVPNNTMVKLVATGEVIKFHHIDGMYSYCTRENGQVCHIVAWEEVEIV